MMRASCHDSPGQFHPEYRAALSRHAARWRLVRGETVRALQTRRIDTAGRGQLAHARGDLHDRWQTRRTLTHYSGRAVVRQGPGGVRPLSPRLQVDLSAPIPVLYRSYTAIAHAFTDEPSALGRARIAITANTEWGVSHVLKPPCLRALIDPSSPAPTRVSPVYDSNTIRKVSNHMAGTVKVSNKAVYTGQKKTITATIEQQSQTIAPDSTYTFQNVRTGKCDLNVRVVPAVVGLDSGHQLIDVGSPFNNFQFEVSLDRSVWKFKRVTQ